jgi:sigma-B regulation protein RsbU (phosphoserine phosphatase)
VARHDETDVSRKHLWAEPLPQGRARLTNQSGTLPICFTDGSKLPPAGWRDLSLPVTLHLGRQVVCIGPAEDKAIDLHNLGEAPLPPGSDSSGRALLHSIAGEGMSVEALIRWFQAATDLLQSATVSLDFFDRAAAALVDLVGLDAGRVLLLHKGCWRVLAVKTAPGRIAADWQPSTRALAKIVEGKRTFWQMPAMGTEGSLCSVDALVVAPILNRQGEVIGALYGNRDQLGSDTRGGGQITRLEAMLAELLAGGVATGLARLEQEEAALRDQRKLLQMERDLEIGREIQAGFLPEKLPQVPGWEVKAHFHPAREVSGDFYDVFALSHEHLAIVIADVCDKGIGAALYMTLLRSLLRAFAQQTQRHGLQGSPEQPNRPPGGTGDGNPADLAADRIATSAVEMTNDYVAQTHAKACMFASVFFGVLDARTGTLTYVNAGHDAPVLMSGAAVKARLAPTGPVVGLRARVGYVSSCISLAAGETLLAYTDGVTEARDPAGQFFTEKRLLALLAQPAPSVADLLDRLVASLEEHIAGAVPYDDVTLLALRRAAKGSASDPS